MTARSDRGPCGSITKLEIFREAIEATGTLDSDGVALIKAYIEGRFPDFGWQQNWFGGILAYKQAVRHQISLEAAISSADSTDGESTMPFQPSDPDVSRAA